MKQDEPNNQTIQTVESTGNGDRQDGVFGEGVDYYKTVRTMPTSERMFVLDQIREHSVLEERHRIRRQRYEQLLRHDNCLVAINSLSQTVKKEENK